MQLPKDVQLVSFRDVMIHPLPPVDWLVTDLIANQDRVVLYGEPGAMKSWLLLHLGVHLAAGKQWLGQFEVPGAKRVLYVDEEMNARVLQRRINRLGVGADLGDHDLSLRLLSLHGVRFVQDGAQRLLDALATSGFDPEVIIVETLRGVMDGSENEAKDVSAFWRNLEPLRQAGKTVIISHHMRKPSYRGINDAQYRASGSTDILAGTDTAIAIMKRNKGLIEVECVKSRNAEEPQNFTIRLLDQPHTQAIEMRFEGYLAGGEAAATQYQRSLQLIIEFLNTQPDFRAKSGAIKAYVVSMGISPSTYNRAWKEVRKGRKVAPAPRQGWQLIEEFRPIAVPQGEEAKGQI